MRALILAPVIGAMLVGPAAAAKDGLPRADCSANFVARWQADPETAIKSMPQAPCWMNTKRGPYVCYKDGCAAAHAYFDEPH